MKNNSSLPRAGFSLVEVTLALGIAAFCMLALVGLVPVGINSNLSTIDQAAAANIAQAIAADIRATPLPVFPTTGTTAAPTSVPTPRYGILVPVVTPNPPNTPSSSPPTAFPLTASNYAIFLAEDGTRVSAAVSARYRATVIFGTPQNVGSTAATTAQILVTWPATADPVSTTLPTKFSGSLETLTAFNRN